MKTSIIAVIFWIEDSVSERWAWTSFFRSIVWTESTRSSAAEESWVSAIALVQVADILLQLALIVLDRQHIIGPAVQNGLGNRRLGPQGVNRHNTAVDIQQTQ